MSRESSSSRAEQIAQHLLIYGREVTVEEIQSTIAAVTLADIERVPRRLLASPPTVKAMGPMKNRESAERIVARLRGDARDGATRVKVFRSDTPQASSLEGRRDHRLSPRTANRKSPG